MHATNFLTKALPPLPQPAAPMPPPRLPPKMLLSIQGVQLSPSAPSHEQRTRQHQGYAHSVDDEVDGAARKRVAL